MRKLYKTELAAVFIETKGDLASLRPVQFQETPDGSLIFGYLGHGQVIGMSVEGARKLIKRFNCQSCGDGRRQAQSLRLNGKRIVYRRVLV
jgi:hypothetical protein